MSQQPFYADLDRWRGILPTKEGNLGKGILKIVNFVYELPSVLTRYIIKDNEYLYLSGSGYTLRILFAPHRRSMTPEFPWLTAIIAFPLIAALAIPVLPDPDGDRKSVV